MTNSKGLWWDELEESLKHKAYLFQIVTMVKKSGIIIIVFLAIFFGFQGGLIHAQTSTNSTIYFPETASKQPIITYLEGFLNKFTYYIDGQESSPNEVANLMGLVTNENFNIRSYQRKRSWGRALKVAGVTTMLATSTYFFTQDIASTNLGGLIIISLGGVALDYTGRHLLEDANMRIEKSIRDFNAYHYSGGVDAYLSMEMNMKLLGPQLEIYEGPMLLTQTEAANRIRTNEVAFQLYNKVLKRQKVSKVTNIASLVLSMGVVVTTLGHEKQSSQPNKIIYPLILTGFGLNSFSTIYNRKTRNMGREALYIYNYQ